MKFFHLIKRTISSVDSPEPYLLRWEWNTRWFTVKLHKFLRSDLAPLHDHPWWFWSFILWGGYTEYLARTPEATPSPTRLRRRWLSLAFRRATDRHRVVLDQEFDLAGCKQIESPAVPGAIVLMPAFKSKSVWTLVLTGPKKREWAFYPVPTYSKYAGRGPIRVPWRVAVAYGENHVLHLVRDGWQEEEFNEIDRGLRAKEPRP